jgi:PAS domain S-box-containing protein
MRPGSGAAGRIAGDVTTFPRFSRLLLEMVERQLSVSCAAEVDPLQGRRPGRTSTGTHSAETHSPGPWRSEESLRSIIDAAHEAFVSMDSDGFITDWNPQAEAIFGWTRAEALGRVLAETIIPPRHRDLHWQGLKRFLATGQQKLLDRRIEMDGLHRDGREFPVELTVTATASGDSWMFHAFLHDISERRQAEAELRKAHDELELRTRELERSNAELEQFAYDASHDLGEPLRIMAQVGERLANRYSELLDSEGCAMIASLVDGAERTQMLISDLLEYSRASREPPKRVPVDCAAVVDETVELLSESIAEKGATISVGPLPEVKAHPCQLAQVFRNLLSNALKYSRDETLEVHVGASRIDHAWRFSVRDNGIGVDPRQA